MQKELKKVCLIGATSGIGVWTAHYLLQQENVRLSVVVRDEKKLKEIFREKYEKFYQVFEGDVEQKVQIFEDMWEKSSSVNVNPFNEWLEDIEVVINTVGPSKMKNIEHSRLVDLETNRLLIAAAKRHRLHKFILVTSMYITRPNTFIGFLLNFLGGMILHHKQQAEHLLRQSGLQYAIVRPGGLKGDKQVDYQTLKRDNQVDYQTLKGVDKKKSIEGMKIMQGETGKGIIQRKTVGRLVGCYLVHRNDERVTMEVVGAPSHSICHSNNLHLLQPDNHHIPFVDHIQPTQRITNILKTFLISTLVLSTSILYYYLTK